jgi:two-component system NtrC family sensor kinase
MAAPSVGGSVRGPDPRGDVSSRELFWHTLGRMVLLYFVPLILLAIFFLLQYRQLLREGLRAHLEVIAEHQAATFDLFLRERLVNLGNIIDDPALASGDWQDRLPGFLASLRQTSDAFVDVGVVDGDGELLAYVGPVNYAGSVSYGQEDWFRELRTSEGTSIITEIYRGFRNQPHFTIAVRRGVGDSVRILRAALSPERLSDYLTTLEGANEVHAAIVNGRGVLQVTVPKLGAPLLPSGFVPPAESDRGFVPPADGTERPGYAFAWLSQTPWALIVTDAREAPGSGLVGLPGGFIIGTLAVFLVTGIVILVRARQVVGARLATERHEAELSGQLVHAAKLASVGELAAGVAHEINNPLAVIAEEVGVLKDSLDPTLADDDDEPLDLVDHLNAIHEAVFRCRDITRKLLTFVRQVEVKIEPHDIHDILDEVLDVMLGNELAISNVLVTRQYDRRIPEVPTDRNQLVQVFVNLVKNAIDAMKGGGTLSVVTLLKDGRISVAVRDTGCGMHPDQLEKVFMPFFTTKEPGDGTGLGLSVSYSIIQSFGGAFYVDSTPGKGSTFIVELPLGTD